MIEPFFFREEQLFGCYHPAGGIGSSRLLVICPPFFDEYRRSYKALADLANACAEQNINVLRFDYFGTGESFGTLDQASVDGWRSDIESAIEEGIALSGADEVCLLGVRFGGTLAAQARHDCIKRYVFWDPVVSGSSYLAWLEEVNNDLKRSHYQLSRKINKGFENIEYEAFHLPLSLRNGIHELLLDQKALEKIAQTYVITTDKTVYDSNIFSNCEFPGLRYDWPVYHDGVISQKPVLEAIAGRVIAS